MKKHNFKETTNILKTARGQIDAVLKMMEDDRYCIDISNQIMAVSSLIKKANLQVLEQHLDSCVKEALIAGDIEEKNQEIMNLISRMIGR